MTWDQVCLYLLGLLAPVVVLVFGTVFAFRSVWRAVTGRL